MSPALKRRAQTHLHIYSKVEKLQDDYDLLKIQLVILSISNKKSPETARMVKEEKKSKKEERKSAPETAHMVPTNFPRPVVGAMSP